MPPESLARCDRVFRWKQNFGSYNRFIPSLAYQSEYTYFHDDDMLPGRRVVENFLQYAGTIGDFGVLGQNGRRFGNGAINQDEVRANGSPVTVDSLVRGYFVRTRNLVELFRRAWRYGNNAAYTRHDDLFLCLSMRQAGLRNYAIPASRAECMMDAKELDDRFSLHRTDPDGHRDSRQKILDEIFFDAPDRPAGNDAGITYLSLGDRSIYLHGALRSADRFAQIPTHIVSDRPYPCEMTRVSSRQHNRWYKTSMLSYTPFSTTLMLDDDTRLQKPISGELLEELLGDCNIAMAPDYYWPTLAKAMEQLRDASWIDAKEWQYMNEIGYGASDTYFNSGVIIARRAKDTIELFQTWFLEWNRFKTIDQLALYRAIKACNVRVKTLDFRLNSPARLADPNAVIWHFYGGYGANKESAIRKYDSEHIDGSTSELESHGHAQGNGSEKRAPESELQI
ncbi:MAG TPA: hypothetical protein VGH90_14205 [Chthoniobacteraceae bacterium]